MLLGIDKRAGYDGMPSREGATAAQVQLRLSKRSATYVSLPKVGSAWLTFVTLPKLSKCNAT